MATSSSTAGLRVLQSAREPTPTTNPYVVQLLDSLRAQGVAVTTFTWRAALLGRYDLVHLHWPEILTRGRGPLRSAARTLLLGIWLVRLSALRTPVVRTLHNLQPHEPAGRVAGALLRALCRRETWWVRLSPLTPAPEPRRTTTVLHGHYRDWFAAHPRPVRVPGRLLAPGVVRPYKGLEELVTAFAHLDRDDLSLHVVGRSQDEALAGRLHAAAAGDPRVTLTLSHVADADLAREVGQAQLVVLPYRQLHNSGAMLLGLSLDRPVLAPRNAVTEDVQREVGAGWLHLFDVPTDSPAALAGVLAAVIDATTDLPPGRPDLDARDWRSAGRQHVQAYRAALAPRGRAHR